MRALIVEDVTACQKLLERFLQNYAECDVVKNGSDGLKAFIESHRQKKPYDIIFTDVMMPEINGIELLKTIRKIETGPDRVKIIMATSLTDKNHVMEAIQNGCDAYMLKPYSKKDIEKHLMDLKLIDKNPA